MQTFREILRPLCMALAGLLFFYCLPLTALAVEEDELRTRNVGFKVTGPEVEVFYDLLAPSDQTYRVAVRLKRRFNKSFLYFPVNVSGDIGSSVVPGENKRIIWKFMDEFPKGLPGEDCFFVVEAEVGGSSSPGISSFVWIAGGAAVVGGVLLAVLLSKGAGSNPPSPIPGFPNPPGRP